MTITNKGKKVEYVHMMFCRNCNELTYCHKKLKKCQECGKEYEYKGKKGRDSFDRYSKI